MRRNHSNATFVTHSWAYTLPSVAQHEQHKQGGPACRSCDLCRQLRPRLSGHVNFHSFVEDGLLEELAGDHWTTRKRVVVSVCSRGKVEVYDCPLTCTKVGFQKVDVRELLLPPLDSTGRCNALSTKQGRKVQCVRFPHPKRAIPVVSQRVPSVGMHKYVQGTVVEREPGNDVRQAGRGVGFHGAPIHWRHGNTTPPHLCRQARAPLVASSCYERRPHPTHPMPADL
jgi:hypothetical protein